MLSHPSYQVTPLTVTPIITVAHISSLPELTYHFTYVRMVRCYSTLTWTSSMT